LDLDYTLPAVTDDIKAADLGITELVHAEVSYFRGSDASRIQNIETASARFHGVLVAPGETFSMAKVIGDVSLDTGYAEAWIIYGDRTIKGVGGGVCQVSTTLFRTVFFSGFPVVERHPHAYRVYYYEQTYTGHDASLAGLDATVYVPLVDFKFTNDTPYWLLMETYMGSNWLQWKFYSTSDGRSVDWSTSGLQNRQDPPEPVYNENPSLPKGEVKQVDWAVEGADVSVTRTVYRDGQVVISDVFNTHYEPWRAVCEYGPGTKGMPPNRVNSSSPCTPNSRGN
jgi:vancomycin resistance protein YoaR